MKNGLTRYYFQKLSEVAVIAVAITVSFYSYLGTSLVSDTLYTLTLLSLGLHFRYDKNLLSILIIITFNHTFPDIVYYFDSLRANVVIKSLIYIFSAYTFFQLRYDKLAKFALALLLCMVAAELYWLLTAYDQTPLITFSIIVVAANIISRHLILQRVTAFKFWSKEIHKTPIDWSLYNLIGLAVPIVALFVIEYFFRHILNIQSAVIYNIYSPLINLTNAAVLWVLLNYALKKTFLFQA